MSEKPTEPTAAPSGMVSKKQLHALSANFFSKVQILDNGKYRPIDCSNPNHPEKSDTKAIVFSKKSVEALFAANPGCDGLKIYFGVHDHEILPIPEEFRERYQNKMMAVLVTTSGQVENLKEEGEMSKMAVAGGGEGLDNGKMCPPLIGC